MNSNQKRTALLGMSIGTASNRLRKAIMFKMAQKLDEDICFRCGNKIDNINELSIEHKEPWQSANDPIQSFFDLDNIAFSHLKCNSADPNLRKKECPKGHPYSKENTYISNYKSVGERRCKICHRDRYMKRYKSDKYKRWRKEYRGSRKHASVA